MLYRTASGFPVVSLRQEIDRLFEDTFGSQGSRRGWVPPVDVRENGREFTFEVELPGIAPEQVDVTADNGVLTVRGEKTQRAEREGEDGRMHFVERSYGAFVRAFQLPQGVDEESISAEFDHGVLTVRVPKATRPQPRRINVATGASRVGAGQVQTGQVGTGQVGTDQGGARNAEEERPGSGRTTDATAGDGSRKDAGARRTTTTAGTR